MASTRRFFVFLQPSPPERHVDAYLPHRAIPAGETKVTMTAISWIHDPDTGMLASQRSVRYHAINRYPYRKGKIAERGNSGFAVR